jgi:hypothetical protein
MSLSGLLCLSTSLIIVEEDFALPSHCDWVAPCIALASRCRCIALASRCRCVALASRCRCVALASRCRCVALTSPRCAAPASPHHCVTLVSPRRCFALVLPLPLHQSSPSPSCCHRIDLALVLSLHCCRVAVAVPSSRRD